MSTMSFKARSKPPSLLACIACRRSHLKCDGRKPTCSRCTNRRTQCIWVESRRGYRDYVPPSAPSTDTNASSSPALQQNINITPAQPSAEAFVLDPRFATNQSYSANDLFNPAATDLSYADVQLTHPGVINGHRGSESTESLSRDGSSSHTDNNKNPSEASNLIDVFYKYFHTAHPFIPPRKLTQQRPQLLPEPVRAVIRFLASHFVPHNNQQALQRAASAIYSENYVEDGYRVQGLLLYVMTCFARSDEMTAGAAMEKAIEIALRIGMNRHSFAIHQARDDPTLQESWRRTWWTLFLVDGLISSMAGPQRPFKLHSIFCDVPLPGPCYEYNEAMSSPQPRSLDDLHNRTFAEDAYEFSSFAYAIEAMYIMGNVLTLDPDINFISPDQYVDSLDVSISSFFLSLPPSKREVINTNTSAVDEVLVVAHMIINWAYILLHRPRSTLTFIRNHYKTTCTDKEPIPREPGMLSTYATHTAKSLHAANALVSLTAIIHRPLSYCSPCLMCGITTAATVHLPAYAMAKADWQSQEQAKLIKERLQLGVSALGAFAEIWPRAEIAKGQVAAFAREVMAFQPNMSANTNHNMIAGVTAILSDDQRLANVGDGGMALSMPVPLSQIEYGGSGNEAVDKWMETLLQADSGVDGQLVDGGVITGMS